MDTNQNEAQQVPEQENQEAVMPAADQQPSEEVTPAEGAQATEVPEGEKGDGLSLPADVKDRTAEQFDKLKQKLAEERARRLEAERFQSTTIPTASSTQEQKPLYDPTTGYVNVEELERIREANAKLEAKSQRVEARLETYLQKQQESEAFEAYPELNPTGKDYNETMHKAVRALITDSMINPRDYGGDELTMKQAAELALAVSSARMKEVAKSAKDRAVKELTPKEQAALEVGSRSDARTRTEISEDIRVRSREGDALAIMERMKNLK